MMESSHHVGVEPRWFHYKVHCLESHKLLLELIQWTYTLRHMLLAGPEVLSNETESCTESVGPPTWWSYSIPQPLHHAYALKVLDSLMP